MKNIIVFISSLLMVCEVFLSSTSFGMEMQVEEQFPSFQDIARERSWIAQATVEQGKTSYCDRFKISNQFVISPTIALIKKMAIEPRYMPTKNERRNLYICHLVMSQASANPATYLIDSPRHAGLKLLKENTNMSFDAATGRLTLKHLGQWITISFADVDGAVRHIDDLIEQMTEENETAANESIYEGVLLENDAFSDAGSFIVKVTKSHKSLIPVGELVYFHPDHVVKFGGAKAGQAILFNTTSSTPIKTVKMATNYQSGDASVEKKLFCITGVQDVREQGAPPKKAVAKAIVAKPTFSGAADFDDYVRGNNLLNNIDRENPNWIAFNMYPTADLVRWFESEKEPAQQGFKLHVSATPESALRVFEVVKSVLDDESLLKTERTMYKMAKSIRFLTDLSYGDQKGKFITIYPLDFVNARSVELAYQKAFDIAKKLDVALRALPSTDFVTIAHERPIGTSGGLFARYGVMYGSSKQLFVLDGLGRKVEEITYDDEDGEYSLNYARQPDVRNGPWKPEWVRDIFYGI